jgi:hypothetical protein
VEVETVATQQEQAPAERVDYQTNPSRYRHWGLSTEGPVATLTMNVNEDGGIRPGYKLKLNSYDLGVDIELREESHLLLRREHLYAGPLLARLESELLQIYE